MGEKIWTKKKLDEMLKKSQKQTFGTSKKKQTTKEDKMRKIVIEECDDDSDSDSHDRIPHKVNEQKEEVLDNDIHEEKDSLAMSVEEFTMDKVPLNFIEFEKLWSRAQNAENRSLILLKLMDKRIDKIIKNMMDDTLFSQMICAVHHIVMRVNGKKGLRSLKQLTKMDRFEMIVMFMSDGDKELIAQMKQKCVDSKIKTSLFDMFE